MKIFITTAFNKKLKNFNGNFNENFDVLDSFDIDSIYYLKLNIIKSLYSNIKKAIKILKENKDITHLVFTSKNGVILFFDYIINKEKEVLNLLKEKQFLAVGPKTALIINKFNYNSIVPIKYLTSSLADLIINTSKQNNYKFLILRSRISNKILTQKLKENNIKFKEIHIYTLKRNPFFKKTKEYKLLKLLIKINKFNNKVKNTNFVINNEYIYIIFTSPSNIKSFFNYFQIKDLIDNVYIKFLPIGPVTYKELINHIKKYYKKQNVYQDFEKKLSNKIIEFPENYTLKDCLNKIKTVN
jgi:uroporphyrinogen-III synthase